MGGTYSGPNYSSGESGYYYEPANSKGAGARAMMNRDNDNNIHYSDSRYSSGDSGYYSEPATTRGAGARAMTGRDNNNYYYSDDTVSYETLRTPDSFADTTQGAGARALTGRPDTAQYAYAQPGVTVFRSTAVGGGEIAGGTTSASSSTLANDDANFLREAMQLGMAEVRMGELAQQKAQNSSLREFGQMIATDHQKSNDELRQLGQQKQFSFSATTAISSKDQAMIDKLSSAEGRDFDRMCERDLIDSHEKAIKLFKHEAEHGRDADLRAFAQKTLPGLEQHLQQAKDLKKEKSNT
jgi:putative membrane protein